MSRKRRSKKATLHIAGRVVTATTIAGLAEAVGKSTDTIRRYERMDIFPTAPLKAGEVRYYPMRLVEALVPIVKKFGPGRKPDPDLIVEINQLFSKEREHYASKKT